MLTSPGFFFKEANLFTTLAAWLLTFNVPVTKMPSTNVFKELCVKITLLGSIPKYILTVCNAVYFLLCIILMHITPPVTAYTCHNSVPTSNLVCIKEVAIRTNFSKHDQYCLNILLHLQLSY